MAAAQTAGGEGEAEAGRNRGEDCVHSCGYERERKGEREVWTVCTAVGMRERERGRERGEDCVHSCGYEREREGEREVRTVCTAVGM